MTDGIPNELEIDLRQVRVLLVKHTLGGQYALNGVAEDVERYLLEQDCHVVRVLAYPLNSSSEKSSSDRRYEDGVLQHIRHRRSRLHPPLSAIWQLFTSRHAESFDIVVGFNVVASIIAFRHARRNGTKVTWRIDFVPPQSRGHLIGWMNQVLERRVLKVADVHIENSSSAMSARSKFNSASSSAVQHIAPVAAWPEWYVDSTPSERPRNVVFLGGINTRTGSEILSAIVADPTVHKHGIFIDIIGGGSELDRVRSSVHPLNSASVTIHGVVKDENLITAILGRSRLALAPYAPLDGSFTEFADPGKLKRYLAAGLPILTSEVPSVATQLAETGGAEIIESSRGNSAWLERILTLLDDVETLDSRAAAARATSTDFLAQNVYGAAWRLIIERGNQQLPQQRGA